MSGHKLFPIPLLGQGTADVESLPSYLFRSAYAHGVSAGIFLKVINELSGNTYQWPKSITGTEGVKIFARVNNRANALREVLSEMTGQDLSCEPLMFLDSRVFCISSEIGAFRWCPECLAEQEAVNATMYIKQIWHMTALTHCPTHGTPLLNKCERCNSQQCFFKVPRPLGHCFHCGNLLSKRKHPLKASQINPSWVCLSQDIHEVFEKASRPYESMIGKLTVRQFILKLSFKLNWRNCEHVKDFPAFIEYLDEYTHHWTKNCKLISLRRIANRLNFSLFDILCSNEKNLQLPLSPINEEELPEHLKAKKKVSKDHKQKYREIKQVLEQEYPPPSLKHLARLTNVSVGYLEYRFPSLVSTVVENHKQYNKKQALNNKYRAQTAAIQYFTDESYSSQSQSRYQAYKVLKEETNIPKWVLIDAINEAYTTLNLDNSVANRT